MLGLPRYVGLDLAAEDVDASQPLPALAVVEMDSLATPGMAALGAFSDTRYLCLTSDNRRASLQQS
jgi:hypothetical protein